MGPEIDEIDSKIICFLQKDGRMAYTRIAEEIGIAEATVRTRAQRMMKDGVIEIVAVCDPVKVGFAMAGNMKLYIESRKLDEIVESLRKMRNITYVAVMIGDSNIDCDFIAESLEDLHQLVYEKIAKIDGVQKIDTAIVSGYKKEIYDYGTCFHRPS